MMTMTSSSTRKASNAAVPKDSSAFWLLAALACLGWGLYLGLLPRGARDRFRAARAELRLRLTRKRLRMARAELREADEHLAATGELLDCYMEEFGPLPINPFAAAADVVDEEWPEELEGTSLKEN